GDDDRPIFSEVAPRIRALKAGVSQVVDHSGSRYTAESRSLFQALVIPEVAALEQPLDRLIDLNERDSARLLEQIEQQLRISRRALVAGGALFVAFVCLVAVATLRLIDRQHHALADRLLEIEQANRDLDAFAGRVAHDLRGPLAPIALGAARLPQVAGRRTA